VRNIVHRYAFYAEMLKIAKERANILSHTPIYGQSILKENIFDSL